jgi:hypothetical protein
MLKHTGGGDVSLESISLELPADISTVSYKDHAAATVASSISLSKWGVPSGKSNVDSNRSSLVLRDLRLSMGTASYYGLAVTRGSVTNTWLNYITNAASWDAAASECTVNGAVDASITTSTACAAVNGTLGIIGDHKFPVLGNANNLNIDFVSPNNKGFKLNSLSWRGQLHLKGSKGV